jgi:hypothetical protein
MLVQTTEQSGLNSCQSEICFDPPDRINRSRGYTSTEGLRFLFYLIFIIPLCFIVSGWWLVHSLFFVISFTYFFVFPYYMVWGNLGYMFGCDYISYDLILFRFWVCFLIIMARESIFRSVYYPNLFLLFVVLLMVILFSAIPVPRGSVTLGRSWSPPTHCLG